MHHQKPLLMALVLVSLLINGCAIGTTRLQVLHDPLDKVDKARQGKILVHTFADKRKEANLEEIGNKRNGFGMVLGHVAVNEGVKLDELLTRYFAEALNAAGYTTVMESSLSADSGRDTFDAVVTGEINEFWMDLYMKVWHKVEVTTMALNPNTHSVVWQKQIQGDESNVLWVGASGEFERVISTALTRALNQATREYASDEFYSAIRK